LLQLLQVGFDGTGAVLIVFLFLSH
jgi:hypothetical protein